jgi:hypothetical protein
MSCGHFNFTVKGRWIFCSDCDAGIDANSRRGQRMIARKQGDRKLDPSQLATFRALQDSYREVAQLAGTTDSKGIQAYLERRNGG